jgi:class 3 adenylate cyclase/tetratricopeptide (TPR) repeat protein
MKCPKCQFDNREGAKFCGKCRTKLSVICPQCDSENPPENSYCDECGHDLREPKETPAIDYSEPQSYTPKFLADKILTTRSSVEGERKLVTVLFADVANYTSISEKLDPEEVHQIMDGAFKVLMDEIHRFEGTINQFTGDGVMALFGAPVAHEDHAQRACHAALSIQSTVGEYGEQVKKETGVEFKMRIGLNSGPVIVGSIGDDLRMDYTAIGDTTNLAARIQEIAKPDEVWMSQETRNIIRDYFHDQPVGEISLKGKAEPQPIYRVLSERKEVRTRFEAGLVRGVTELVGRRPEMEALRSAFERMKAGEAHVVDVVGEAGVGKSRLVYEFQRSLGRGVNFLSGYCVHYGRNINFLPVMDLVKVAFDIEEGMTEREVGRLIEEKAKNGLATMIPFYRNLLSLKVEDPEFNDLNPEGRKFGTFEAAKRLLFKLSEEKPLVVFLDDVHWMDKISEEFFTYFSRSFLDHPILMLTAYRPEGDPSWAQGAHYQRLGLETLSSKSSIRLVRNIAGGLELDPAFEERIVEKTGGNPFFVEEIVRELLERGDLVNNGDRYVCTRPINQCEIPNTVQGVLAARMDRLSEDLKRTMQVASVIGRDFAFRLLKSIMALGDELRTRLSNLVGLQILYEKALYPELEYIFKHALTQEVAYASLLKQRRQKIHGRIARAIEEIYADRLEQHYELLAHHWELSDTPERSIEYLVLAGEKSNRSYAASAAVDFFTRALKHIQRSDQAFDSEVMLRIREGRAGALHTMGRIEESLGDYQEAIRLASTKGDQHTVLRCLTGIPILLFHTKLKDEVPKFCKQGLELARSLEDKGAEASILANYAYWRYVWQGSSDYETLYQALNIAEESGKPLAILNTRILLSLLERWRGTPQKALELSEGIVEILQSALNIYVGSVSTFVRGMALSDVGKYSDAIRLLRKWIEICQQNSVYLNLGRCYNILAWTFSEIYNLEKSLQFNNQALDNVTTLQSSPSLLPLALEMQSHAKVNLMENNFELGQINVAWDQLTLYEKESVHMDYDFIRYRWSTRMKDLKGNILLSRGDLDGAEEIARECLKVAKKREMKKFIGRAERLFGQILVNRGAYAPAEAKLRNALAKLEEVGNPKQLWMTHTAMARLYEKMNMSDRKREHWKAAAAIVETTAEGLQDEGLRSTFLNAGPIQEILRHANP